MSCIDSAVWNNCVLVKRSDGRCIDIRILGVSVSIKIGVDVRRLHYAPGQRERSIISGDREVEMTTTTSTMCVRDRCETR